MEATALFTLPLILFLSFTTNGVSASRGISNVIKRPDGEVVDYLGNKLQSGQYYYLSPVIALPRLYTAAIVPAIYHPGNTWLQLEIEVFTFGIKGLPVKFSPASLPDDGSIYESVDLTIKFTDELSPVGGETSVWKVDKFGFVSLGGEQEDRSSWFKIEKASETGDRIYKIVSRSNSEVDRAVGISTRAYGTERLALADEPLRFVFIPSKDGHSAPK